MLTYFSELEEDKLDSIFTQDVIDELAEQKASIALAILDLSSKRADIIRKLNRKNINVHAWLVLKEEDGYWLNADNAELALKRYQEIRQWLVDEDLKVRCIGLDIEPHFSEAKYLLSDSLSTLKRLFHQRRSEAALDAARDFYRQLVTCIREDGYQVESYQFPLIVDERDVGTSILQRILGVVDIAVDREVLMLYRTLLPGYLADSLIDGYGVDADAIAVGITGGGIDFVLKGRAIQSYHELVKDLKRAYHYSQKLYIFSLEGCIDAGFFHRLGAIRFILKRTIQPQEKRRSVVYSVLRGMLKRSLFFFERF